VPSLQQLWSEYKDKGLHIIHIESQGHSADEVRAFCEKRGVTFPNTTDRGGFSAYPGDNGLPYAYVIGVEGKVLFQGRGNYKEVIHQELAKVRYAGLGKRSVAEPVHKAATLFAGRQYAKAIAEAEKTRDKLAADAEKDASKAAPEAVADAEYVIARALKVAERRREGIEKSKASRDYDLALEGLDILAASFKGHEIGDTAKEERKTLAKDDAVEKELKAFAALASVDAQLAKENDPEKKKATYQAFAGKFEGTRAAERALAKAK